MLVEQIILIVSSATVATILVGVYCWRLSKTGKEYEEAKGTVQMILGNLNKKLKNQDEKIDHINITAELALSEANRTTEKVDDLSKEVNSLTKSLEATLKAETVMAKHISSVYNKIETTAKAQNELQEQIKSLDDRYRGLLPEAEKPVVLPVDGEVAIANLTQTELQILRILAIEGPKPAPELKVIVGKTREHTARLMKKLFDEGYVERETGIMPYRYKLSERIKPTIEQLVKKEKSLS
jgi:DNA-binding MarR family transcriptional regulator